MEVINLLSIFLLKDTDEKDKKTINYFKNNKKIILGLVKKNGFVLNNTSLELKNDKEIVSHAVNTHGLALQFASDNLKNNYEIVSLAVKNNGFAFACMNPFG
jgi:Co/Zn/Cd efflux system component